MWLAQNRCAFWIVLTERMLRGGLTHNPFRQDHHEPSKCERDHVYRA